MIQILAKTNFKNNIEYKTLPVSIDVSICDLKKLIQINFGLQHNFQKLTIQQQDYSIRLIESFTLEFYGIQNNQEIFVDIIQDPKSHFKSSFDLKKLSSAYNPSFIEQTLNLFRKKQQQVWNSLYAHNFILSLNKEYKIQKGSALYELSQEYFKICKKENMKNIDRILNKFKNLEQKKLVKILNQKDSLGWPGILYAIRNQIYYFVIQICEISKGKVFDCQSYDGWTVVSYCVFQKNWNLLLKILKFIEPRQVQIETSKGSLPHYLLKYSPEKIILEILFNKLIDPDQIDSSLQRALDVCQNQRKKQIIEIMKIVNIPFKPFGIIDEVQKNYFFRGWQNQYLKLDFNTFSLQVFNTLQDIPFVMKRIIPIKQLTNIQFLKYNTNKEKFQYFQFQFNGKKHEYRIKSERVEIWKEVLKRFQFFSKYYKKYIIKEDVKYQKYIEKNWKQINNEHVMYQLYLNDKYRQIHEILFSKKLNEIQNFPVKISDFQYIQKLGSGAFANVFKVIHKKSGQILALKTINKNNLIKTKTQRFAQIEKQILQQNEQNSFLITLHFAFQNDQFLYIVEDYCKNGDIESLLNQQPERNLPISIVRIYAAQILLALEELHKRNYIYRDLKPENLLIDDQGYIKLADFGLCAQNIKLKSQYSTTFCGTPYYLSPEMIKNKQSYKVSDFFSFGVLIYELIRGMPPFTGMSKSEIYQKIKKNNITIEEEYFDQSSMDLINRLTEKDPLNRLGYENIQDIFQHQFFDVIDWEKLKNRQIPSPIQFDKNETINHDFQETQKARKQKQTQIFNEKRYFEDFDYMNPQYQKFYQQNQLVLYQIFKQNLLIQFYLIKDVSINQLLNKSILINYILLCREIHKNKKLIQNIFNPKQYKLRYKWLDIYLFNK